MRTALLIPIALLAACGERQPASDSTAALPVDTMRPVVVDSASVDTVATPAASSSTGTKAATRTAPATTTKRDSLSPNIGRDSVIRPKGRMPAIDTPARKP
ncbi:MAG TPA: hypothetical protein VFO66_00475 [Gemmatimonadaceae bacterium]|nr:hypothetical protein [Gemmatimonadaceae bacterium]